MRRNLLLANQGFTLIEVLIAISIFAIAILGFHQGQAGSVKMAFRSEKRSQAYALAQQKMTELELQLKNRSFQALPEEEKGDFKDEELKAFRWIRKLERIDGGCFIPAPTEESESGSIVENKGGGGLFELAQKIFEDAVRKIRVTVVWEENKKVQKATLSQLYVRWEDMPSVPTR